MPRPTIQFLTRPGCGLCDDALPSVRRLASWLRCELEVRDISHDPALEAHYHLRIPVLLDRYGRVVAEGDLGGWKTARALMQTKRRR